MEFIKYVILGIIQGITEPLPISSSGHLLILREALRDRYVFLFNLVSVYCFSPNFGSIFMNAHTAMVAAQHIMVHMKKCL